MVEMIAVVPSDTGWTVKTSAKGELQFSSGRMAEQKAREIGAEISSRGQPAEIRIFLRDGSLAGKFTCPAELEVA